MNDNTESFRHDQPLAWIFHRNTCRWAHNATAASQEIPPQPPKELPQLPSLNLPAPELPNGNFSELLLRRCSCRRYAAQPLTPSQVSSLLYASYGVLDSSHFGAMEFLERPVPSGGGLFPLELYVLVQQVEGIAPGIYHYAVIGHCLEQLREVLVPLALREYLLMGQRELALAPIIFVISAVVRRSLVKYGDRGYRYILFEAGHVAQNLNLAALALGLGSCNIGGFFDQELGSLLCLEQERELPLYCVSVGYPTSDKPQVIRGFSTEE